VRYGVVVFVIVMSESSGDVKSSVFCMTVYSDVAYISCRREKTEGKNEKTFLLSFYLFAWI